jgi:GT2 family glycosyltransferase
VASKLRVSVVIASVRPAALRRTLDALRHQRHREFEVIVVEGPSFGSTRTVEQLPTDTRIAHCPEANLSRARNIGIAAASGEIVAFIDDDAIPEAHWLADLLAAYEDERVGGAGGVVIGRDGWWPEYGPTLSDRLGRVRFDLRPPYSAQLEAGADPFVFLRGGNMSFRREQIVAIGGFDEALALAQDDVDVCLRLIDTGVVLRPLPNAFVHHHRMVNAHRPRGGLPDPEPSMYAFAYFAARHGYLCRPAAEVDGAIEAHAEQLRAEANQALSAGAVTDDEHEGFLDRLGEALAAGRRRALESERWHHSFPTGDPTAFRRYGSSARATPSLRICVLASSLDRRTDFTNPLAEAGARALAALGHDVHLVSGPHAERVVDFDRSLWLHRVAAGTREALEGDATPIDGELYAMAAQYHEVCHLHARASLDLVVAPLANGVGLMCLLDPRYTTLTQLESSDDARIRRAALDDPREAALARLERAVRERAPLNSLLAAGQTVDHCRGLLGAEQNPGDARPDPNHDTTMLASELSSALSSICGFRPTEADRVALRLLDHTVYPVDLCAELLGVWGHDDEQFVRALHRLLLDREVDAYSLVRWLEHLAVEGSRFHIVEYLAGAHPARGIPVGLADEVRARLRRERRRRVDDALALPDQEFLRAVHLATLGRMPPQAWLSQAMVRLREGESRKSVAQSLAELPEARLPDVPTPGPMRHREPRARRARRAARVIRWVRSPRR